MKINIKIKVTQENIDCGIVRSTFCCPIALAIKQKMSPEQQSKIPIIVYSYYAKVGEEDYMLPNSAINFIKKFDKGYKVEPFKFELTETI